jgi:RNA recognition motif-containing protein
MDTKLYVGNLSYNTTEEDLRALFAQAGNIQAVDMIVDRDTRRPKGFAFVTMTTQAEAENAIRMFNGKRVDERELTVNIARPREERPSSGGYRSGSSNRGGGGRSSGGGGSNRRY